MIGTILGLVVALALLPIQRSVEAYSGALGRLFRDDRTTQLVFLFLSVLCVVCFAGSGGIAWPITGKWGFVFSVVVTGVVLDCLRLYFRHATMLLDPREAIGRLVEDSLGRIQRLNHSVSKASRKLARARGTETGQVSYLSLMELFRRYLTRYPVRLSKTIEDLAGIAGRAVLRGDLDAAQSTCVGLASIVERYAQIRGDSLILRPVPESPLTLVESDLDFLLTPGCEALVRIVRTAAKGDQELIVIAGLSALAKITRSVTVLRKPDSSSDNAGLGWKPLGYYRTAGIAVIRSGCDDAGVEASHILVENFRVAVAAAPGATALAGYSDTWKQLAEAFLVKRNAAAAELVLRDWMAGLTEWSASSTVLEGALVSHALDTLMGLLPLMLANESWPTMVPFAPYNVTGGPCIAGLVERAAERAAQSAQTSAGGGPLLGFVESCEPVRHHLRRIGDENDLSNSILLLLILQTLRRISGDHLKLLLQFADEDSTQRASVVNSLIWHLSFCWVAFHKKPTISVFHARDAADVLAWTAMYLLKLGYPDDAVQCASFIWSIAASAVEAKDPQVSVVAEILLHAWYVELSAGHLSHQKAAKAIGEATARVLSGRAGAADAFEAGQNEWRARSSGEGKYALRDPAEQLLHDILSKHHGA